MPPAAIKVQTTLDFSVLQVNHILRACNNRITQHNFKLVDIALDCADLDRYCISSVMPHAILGVLVILLIQGILASKLYS